MQRSNVFTACKKIVQERVLSYMRLKTLFRFDRLRAWFTLGRGFLPRDDRP